MDSKFANNQIKTDDITIGDRELLTDLNMLILTFDLAGELVGQFKTFKASDKFFKVVLSLDKFALSLLGKFTADRRTELLTDTFGITEDILLSSLNFGNSETIINLIDGLVGVAKDVVSYFITDPVIFSERNIIIGILRAFFDGYIAFREFEKVKNDFESIAAFGNSFPDSSRFRYGDPALFQFGYILSAIEHALKGFEKVIGVVRAFALIAGSATQYSSLGLRVKNFGTQDPRVGGIIRGIVIPVFDIVEDLLLNNLLHYSYDGTYSFLLSYPFSGKYY